MTDDRDPPRPEAETPNQETPVVAEAQARPPNHDSIMPDEAHERQEKIRPDEESPAAGDGFIAPENPGMSGPVSIEDIPESHNESAVGASFGSDVDAQSNQPGDETRSILIEPSDDGNATSETESQGSRIVIRRRYVPEKGPARKAFKRRIARVGQRLGQQADYAELVEDRLADLEKRLEKMEGRRSHRVADTASTRSVASWSRSISPEPTKRYEEILGINRMTFEQYKPTKPVDPRPTYSPDGKHRFGPTRPSESSPRHIIEVVLPHHSISDVSLTTSGMRVPGVGTVAGVSSRDAAVEGLASRDSPQIIPGPERIRINSGLLLDTLELITKLNFSRTRFAGHEGQLKTQVILRPFKSLVTSEPVIRKHLEFLKNKVALLHAQGSMSPSGVEPSGEMLAASLGTEVSSPRLDGPSGSKSPHREKPTAKGTELSTIGAKENIETTERCLQELQILVDLLDNDLKPIFDLRAQIEKGDISSIAFHDLWHLFRIGGEIRANEGPHSQVYRIVDIRGGRPALCTRLDAEGKKVELGDEVEALAGAYAPRTFTINCFCFGFDGKHLGPVQRFFDIEPYEDVKPVNSLPVYPIAFSGRDDGDLNREDFISRGKKFVELTKDENSVVHKRYHGLSMGLEQLREEVDSEVIIDTSMALLKNPSLELQFGIRKSLITEVRETLEFLDPDGCKAEGCHQNTAIHRDYEVDDERRDAVLDTATIYQDLTEVAKSLRPEDLLICPSMVYGYVLRSRKWVLLYVGVVEDIAAQEFGFDSLVLPKGHSETLLALVETHSKGAKPVTGRKVVERQIDLVRGKGKGLIILLHGEPGVGKTSTAECVAEYTKRPLFQVTCGDIGSSAEVVERTLENHFQLAHKWGCVLLLDEADVFLMSRSKQDLKRNAIVSVFLRVLEYYSGILFLTTNRVGTFDPAFRSRIHMSFFYPKLNLRTSLEIWKKNLDRTRKLWAANIEIEPEERDRILAFAEDHFKESEKFKTTWNGRQIRNAFQTAMALAEYEVHKARKRFKMAEDPVPRLEAWQFEKVAEASKHFDEYLKATVGLEEDRARENFERRDDLGVEDADADGGGRKRRTARS